MFATRDWSLCRGGTFVALLLVPVVALQVASKDVTQASGGFSVATETKQQVSLHDSSSVAVSQSDGVAAKRAKASKWDWEALTDIGNLHGLIDFEKKSTPSLSEETCKKMFQASKSGLAGLKSLSESG